MNNIQPIRTCIACRSKYPQKTLLRLRQDGKEVIIFNKRGRSFYICRMCANNEKKVKSLTKRFKQDMEYFVKLLKELMNNE